PNDNYWYFNEGPRLTNPNIVTVAPGMTYTKTAAPLTYSAVGDTITFNRVVENIGSVSLGNVTVTDAMFPGLTCSPTTLPSVNLGQTPNRATCTGTYQITQADIDRGYLVNSATATAVPAHGTVAPLTRSVRVEGPTAAPGLSLVK